LVKISNTSAYIIIGLGIIAFAIIAPDALLGAFVNSIYALVLLPPPPPTPNYIFTIEVLRGVLIIFGLVFLIPASADATGVRSL